eukprot:1158291-Pelagomonas_calceolata.AAC.3
MARTLVTHQIVSQQQGDRSDSPLIQGLKPLSHVVFCHAYHACMCMRMCACAQGSCCPLDGFCCLALGISMKKSAKLVSLVSGTCACISSKKAPGEDYEVAFLGGHPGWYWGGGWDPTTSLITPIAFSRFKA